MISNIKNLLARRENEHDDGLSTTHLALLITILVLFIISSILIGTLYVLRSTRRERKAAQLPLYEKRQSNPHGLTITTNKGQASVVYSEKPLISPSTPSSPVPEIRITFPDEVDETGKRQQGRVVVVKVGDHSVGLEPVQELPPYSRDSFDSLDLDRMGGLKEKDDKYYS